MEDLLASIRKAIHEDMGDGPAAAVKDVTPASRIAEPLSRATEELSAAASEIQQLRAKITRSRASDSVPPPPPAEPPPRSASLSAALHSDTPRRSWRDIEPAPSPVSQPQPQSPPPRLRGSVTDAEPLPRSFLRNDPPPPPQPRPAMRAEPTPPRPQPQPQPEAQPPRPDASTILSGNSAQAVQSAFSRLADSVLSRATGERSIEDMTRELLRGMLKQWLDENLPAMVERLVREEIERVARTGR